MLYIITALYAEAVPFIHRYGLKPDSSFQRLKLYRSKENDVLLLITGTGKINAAISLTELLVTNAPQKSDYLINTGICGIWGKNGNESLISEDVYICTHILDHDTDRFYYPDILFEHPFKEAGIETFSTVISASGKDGDNDNYDVLRLSRLYSVLPSAKYKTPILADMEASAVYQACAPFFTADRIIFLKIPADTVITQSQKITALMENAMPQICGFTDSLKQFSDNTSVENLNKDADIIFSQKEQAIFNTVSDSLRLSAAMQSQLKQLFIYYKLRNGNIEEIALPNIQNENITNQKRTILFEQFRKQFL